MFRWKNRQNRQAGGPAPMVRWPKTAMIDPGAS